MRALRSWSGAAPSTASAHRSSSDSGRRASAGGRAGGAGAAGAGFSGRVGLSSSSRTNGSLNGFFLGTAGSLSVAAEAEALHLAPERGGGDVQLPRHLLQAAAGTGERPLDGFPLGVVHLLRERLHRAARRPGGAGSRAAQPLQEDLVRADRVAPRQGGGLLDHVLQLAHVAREPEAR